MRRAEALDAVDLEALLRVRGGEPRVARGGGGGERVGKGQDARCEAAEVFIEGIGGTSG